MTQDVILEKFKKYLHLVSKKYLKKLEDEKSLAKDDAEKNAIDQKKKEHTAYIQQFIQALNEGHCHGFSICHAAMDCIGKLKWWEYVLCTLANWDESEKALNQPFNLPGGTTTDKDKSLDSLFNRALNYIVYHQTVFVEEAGFGLQNTTQWNLLKAADKNDEKKRFLLINENKAPSFIKNRVIAAGYFSKDDLLSLLDGNLVRGNICIIGSNKHTIRIGYDGQSWMIYNPNYDHCRLDKIHKIFGSKKELIDKVLYHLKHELVLQIATTHLQPLAIPYFESMLKNRKTDLIRGRGLSMLAFHLPAAANQVMQSAVKNLTLRNAITEALAKKYDSTWATLHVLVRCASDATNQLVELVVNTKDQKLLKAIANGLLEKNKDDWTTLHMLARYAPDVTIRLFQFAVKTKEDILLSAIANVLLEKNNSNMTALQMLAKFAPGAVIQLLQLLAAEPQHHKLLYAFASIEKNNPHKTWLYYLVRDTPDQLNELFLLVEQTKDLSLLNVIALFVKEKNADGENGLCRLARKSPALLKQLIQVAGKMNNNILLNAITSALQDKNNHNWTGLRILAKHAPEATTELFLLAAAPQNQELLFAINLVLRKHIKNTNDILHAIIKALVTPSNNQIAWQTSALIKNFKPILAMIVICLEKLTMEQLVELGQKLRVALYDPNSEYRGLCAPYDKSIFRDAYGKTNIWQTLMRKTQELMKAHLKDQQITNEVQGLLDQKISRVRW